MSDRPGPAKYDYLFQDEELISAFAASGVFFFDMATRRHLTTAVWDELGVAIVADENHAAWTDRVHPDELPTVREAIRDVILGRSNAFSQIFRVEDLTGTWRWIHVNAHVLRDGDTRKARIIVGSAVDVTANKQSEENLRRAVRAENARRAELETIRQVTEVIGSSLSLSDTIEMILQQTQRVIPYDRATVQAVEDGYHRVIGGYGFRNLREIMQLRFPYPQEGSLSTQAIRDQRPIMTGDVQRDFPVFSQADEERPTRSWLGIPLLVHGEAVGLLALDHSRRHAYTRRHIDIAQSIASHIAIAFENARMHERTYELAMQDALTRVGSRHRLEIEGRLLFESARRTDTPLSVMMIDLDEFKQVNDQYGHQAGDRVLQRVARSAGEALRVTDLIARYGGEEFTIVLPNTAEADAVVVAERISRDVAAEIHPEVSRPVTVSIGVAETTAEDTQFADLLARADTALYHAKESGRNRVSIAARSGAASS